MRSQKLTKCFDMAHIIEENYKLLNLVSRLGWEHGAQTDTAGSAGGLWHQHQEHRELVGHALPYA